MSTPGLLIASDGSYHERKNTGSYAWILSTPGGTRAVHCSGNTTAHRGSSYRSEAYGILSVYVFLHLIQDYFQITLNVHAIYSDSKSVLDTLQHWNTWKPRSTLKPDWDVFEQIQFMTTQVPHPIKYQHIKAHQDDKEQYDNLSLPSQLNVDADHLAGQVPPIPGETPAPVFPTTRIHLHHTTGTVTARIRNSLYEFRNFPQVQQKLLERWDWERHMLDWIDWKAFRRNRRANRRKKIINPVTHTKLIHRLLPIALRQHRNNPARPAHCPHCQFTVETDRHIYSCPHVTRKDWRTELQQAIVKWYIDDPFTQDTLANLLLQGVMSYVREEPTPEIHIPTPYQKLWDQQTQLGWSGLFTGLLSTEWHRLQEQYLRTCPSTIPAGPHERPHRKPKTVQLWIAKLIERFQREWKKLWQLRNSAQHGAPDDPQSQAAAKRKHLLQEIRQITDLHDYLPPLYQNIIEVHQQHQLNMQTTALESWLVTWGTLYQKIAHRAIAASKIGLQSITNFITTTPREEDKYPP